jgi:hypothetical protein
VSVETVGEFIGIVFAPVALIASGVALGVLILLSLLDQIVNLFE